ncbi:MAG: TonB-dependent receptor, partial [Bacteroidetes bacterium]|nr:TonB-dependent receptor [Bacteroidota bacterium]
ITFRKALRIQAGVDNILDHVDANNLPNAPGRTFYAGISYTFRKTNNN